MPNTLTDTRTTTPKRRRTSVQKFRFYSQLFSLAINVWIGVQFYLFVVFLERGGDALYVPRPAGVEGWLPISSLVSLRYWWETGIVNNIHPAGLMIFAVILLVALLFKKGFCSWVCPIGFVSEILGDISDKIFKRRIKPWVWLDYPLRSLKYILLGFFIWAVLIQMTPESTKAFVYSNYNVVADILMLRFFTDISTFALSVIAALFLLSLVVRGFWCRYLCPYGGLLGILNFISPTRIIRDKDKCIDCAACARVCPTFIKVDKVGEVRSDECTGCLACVDSCPVPQTLQVHLVSKKRPFSKIKWAAALVIIFWGSLLVFKLVGPWDNSVTTTEYIQHMPAIRTGQYMHP
ncbi:MAG: 4Fe-4S binding protein [Candidatus Zixiibacteriota bacterium]